MPFLILAGWQSGYAAACKAVYSGSIPDSASNIFYLEYCRFIYLQRYNASFKCTYILD